MFVLVLGEKGLILGLCQGEVACPHIGQSEKKKGRGFGPHWSMTSLSAM